MRNLDQILVFVHVAKFLSFSKAAKALQMPVSTVSRKVSELEHGLGFNLLVRSTRSLRLSTQGYELFVNTADLIERLGEAQHKLLQKSHDLVGTLKISAPVILNSREFHAFIAEFLTNNPGIKIDLFFTNEFVDMVTSGTDVAIRIGDLADSSIVAKRLGSTFRALAASSIYLSKNPKIKTIQNINEHQCILFAGRKLESSWILRSNKKSYKVNVNGVISCSDFYSVYNYICNGLGIAFLPEYYLNLGINSNILSPVLPKFKSASIPVHIVTMGRKLRPAIVHKFISEISDWDSPYWS